jgi:DNA-binding transcriptional LysR family regulator
LELKWLKDYLALAEQGTFSKAATARFVTQPALSRRIRALEAWMGVSLIDRNQYPISFTPAGEVFIERAQQLTDSVYLIREQLHTMERCKNELTISSQHALAVSFFPDWIEKLDSILNDTLIRLDTVDFNGGVEAFLAGNSDFLLCYSSVNLSQQLQREDIESLSVGFDELIPVSLANSDGSPLFTAQLTTQENSVLPMLSHPPQSFFGQLITSQCFSHLPSTVTLDHRYQSSLSEGLKALVLKGLGIAFLPRSIIAHEIDTGQIVQLTDVLVSMPLEIKLLHLKDSESVQANKLWQSLVAHTEK